MKLSRIAQRRKGVALAAAVTASLCIGGLSASPSAQADTAPLSPLPQTVTADALPTMQVNGIVWSQVVVGTTVYATGNFTKARPDGAAVGVNETPAVNIVAYDIRTGVRIASFNHTLDGQGLALAASPDGSRIYVGGEFSTVDGVAHKRIAAFNARTGALDNSFTGGVSGGKVDTIVATNSAVYIGGSFSSVGGQARTNLAGFTPTGALLGWAPVASREVRAMLMAPSANGVAPDSKVIVAGFFETLNGTSVHGMGAVATAAPAGTAAGSSFVPSLLPWAINQVVLDYGASATVDTLSTDGKLVFGGAYAFGGTQNFEGRFAADPQTGNVVWLNDCHGDTYATVPINGALYSVGHAHDCSAVGSFPQTNPWQWHRALAESITPSGGKNVGPDNYGWNFNGVPDTTVLQWFPEQTAAPQVAPAGTVAVSGALQAGWSLATDGTYLAVGGEMTAAGSKPHQGLVRYALPKATKPAMGPEYASVLAPTAVAGATAGTATVTIKAAWDRDNQNLTYALYRDGGATPVYSTVLASTFWQLTGTATFNDTGLSAGTHTYKLVVSDPDGNTVPKSSTVVITTGAPVVVSPPVNLALKKPVTVSKVYTGSTINAAANAVDGDPGTMGLSDTGAQSWWQVDLGASKKVTKISVLGRSKCCVDQSADLWVFASNAPFNTKLTPAAQAKVAGVYSLYQAGTATPAMVFTLPANSTARYIMVQHGGTNYLALNEVTVN